MAYTLSFALSLGSSQTGLTLKAQLVDTAGSAAGSEVTTGFVEFGAGNYGWTYADFTDGFRGFVEFYTGTLPAGLKTVAGVNPEESAGFLAAGERDAIAAALLDLADGVETGLTPRQFARLAAAVLLGKSSGGGAVYRDTNDTKARVTATLDGLGNRTAVTRDAT